MKRKLYIEATQNAIKYPEVSEAISISSANFLPSFQHMTNSIVFKRHSWDTKIFQNTKYKFFHQT